MRNAHGEQPAIHNYTAESQMHVCFF